MKSLLKAKKGWFIFTYLVGMAYFTYYLVFHKDDNADAMFANIMLIVFAHVFTLGASSICDERLVRRKLLWRTFAIFVALFSIFLFFTPQTMGLIGGYVSFCGIGFIHTRIIKEEDMFAHLKKAETADDASKFSDRQWKYILWGAFSLLPLFLLYWNI